MVINQLCEIRVLPIFSPDQIFLNLNFYLKKTWNDFFWNLIYWNTKKGVVCTNNVYTYTFFSVSRYLDAAGLIVAYTNQFLSFICVEFSGRFYIIINRIANTYFTLMLLSQLAINYVINYRYYTVLLIDKDKYIHNNRQELLLDL